MLVIGWGSTYGPIGAGVRRVRKAGFNVAQVHLRHLNPFPKDLGDILRRYDKILVPEMNLGQLSLLLRGRYLVDAIGYNHVNGLPLKAAALADAIGALVAEAEGVTVDLTPSSTTSGGEQVSTTEKLPFPGLRSGVELIPTNDEPQTGKEYTSDQEVRWCPGCGDYAVLKAVQGFLPQLGLRRENIVFVSGIGCSSRFPYYLDTYGMHSIHGRAPSIATGIATAREDLSVWVVTGDGDALSIGGNHLIHALRRNVNMTILLFNNRIYGLTKGQYSPTSETGKITKSTPMGSLDHPFNPVSLALGAEGSFVARTIDSDRKHLTSVLSAAAAHRGTSFVEIYQNCPIFNDGAFDAIKNNDTKADAIIPLVHGEPIRFGVGGLGQGPDPRLRHRRRQGRRGLRRRRRRDPGPRRPQRRPVHRVRDLPAHRLRLPQPVPDRHLPPGRAADVRRPGPRPDRHRPRRRPRRPDRPPRRPHRRRRHLDRRLSRLVTTCEGSPPESGDPSSSGTDHPDYPASAARTNLRVPAAASDGAGISPRTAVRGRGVRHLGRLPALLAAAGAGRRGRDPGPPGAVVLRHDGGPGAGAAPHAAVRAPVARSTGAAAAHVSPRS